MQLVRQKLFQFNIELPFCAFYSVYIKICISVLFNLFEFIAPVINAVFLSYIVTNKLLLCGNALLAMVFSFLKNFMYNKLTILNLRCLDQFFSKYFSKLFSIFLLYTHHSHVLHGGVQVYLGTDSSAPLSAD
jgi:hypothetical protein